MTAWSGWEEGREDRERQGEPSQKAEEITKATKNRQQDTGTGYTAYTKAQPLRQPSEFTLFNAINLQGSWEICSRQAPKVGKDRAKATRTRRHLPWVPMPARGGTEEGAVANGRQQ